MKVLFVSPLSLPINSRSTYVGIERLVWEYCRELAGRGHEVTVMGHSSSEFPDGVSLLPTTPDGDGIFAELKQYQSYQYMIREFDVVHDFSHLHLASRFMPNLPSLNLFWHAPALAQYPKANYNIIALSEYAAREFKRVYRQEAKYQQSITIDTAKYKLSKRHRNDRFLAIGRLGEEKGHHLAIQICKQGGYKLDIIAARGVEMQGKPFNEYENMIMNACDGKQIRFLGDIGEVEKIKYMQTNKALIYATTHPEVTNHKVQECLLCGMPVVVSGIGAAYEIVTDGVDGFLCRTLEEFVEKLGKIDELDCPGNQENLVKRYSVGEVVKGYLPLYEEVKGGARW